MSRMYRIKAVAPDEYIVQEPFLWLFWRSPFRVYYYDCSWTVTFPTVEKAQQALDDLVSKLKAIEKHVAQKPLYVTYSREWLG